MEEIVKHINDTNASFRTIGAGDAKNTDLFLDNEHFELFRDAGERVTVRFNKENLQFYHDWNEIYQGREEGPEMDKNYGFRHHFFCQEHNVSWKQLLRTENDQAVIAYMQFFEKHPNLLDILKNR